MSNLLILGAGGFGHVIKEIAESTGAYGQIAFLDDNNTGEDIIGKCSDYKNFANTFEFAFPAFGNNALRLKWIELLHTASFFVPTIKHSTAYVSPSAKLGTGSVVLPMAVVNSRTVLGKGCIINCGAVVDHDCKLSDGVHICLNAACKAGCKIEALIKIEAGEVLKSW